MSYKLITLITETICICVAVCTRFCFNVVCIVSTNSLMLSVSNECPVSVSVACCNNFLISCVIATFSLTSHIFIPTDFCTCGIFLCCCLEIMVIGIDFNCKIIDNCSLVFCKVLMTYCTFVMALCTCCFTGCRDFFNPFT